MRRLRLCGAVFLLSWFVGLHSALALNQEQEARYYELLATLRCLVCQNQSLADSAAGLADDLRTEVYKMVEQGASNDEIYVYMTDRYGDYVLYEPPLKPHTYALWFGPFILLLLVLSGLLLFIRRRAKDSNINPPSSTP